MPSKLVKKAKAVGYVLLQPEHISAKVIIVIFLSLAVHSTFYHLGLYPYLVTFFLGVVSTALAGPPLCFLFWRAFISKEEANDLEPGDELAEGVRISQGLTGELQGSEALSLEDITKQDRSGKTTAYGTVEIEFAGKKKTRRTCYAALKGSTLFWQVKNGKGWDKTTKYMVVEGAYIKANEDYKHHQFSIEINHPERCLLHKVDYVTVRTTDLKTMQRWWGAFCRVCLLYDDLYTGVLDHVHKVQSFKEEIVNYKKWGDSESAHFINFFLSRIWIHVRESVEMKRKLLEALSLRLSEKISEKNLASNITDLILTNISLGCRPPRLHDFTIVKPEHINSDTNDLSLDCMLDYSDGFASLSLQCHWKALGIKGKINGTITIIKLKGKINLSIPPYPFQKMAIMFYEEPELELDIQLDVLKHGFALNKLPAGLSPFLQAKLREMLTEKFVHPNRKYIKVPGTPKKEPPRPVTAFKVSSILPEEGDETLLLDSSTIPDWPQSPAPEKKQDNIFANPELQNMVLKKKILKGKEHAKALSAPSSLRNSATTQPPTSVAVTQAHQQLSSLPASTLDGLKEESVSISTDSGEEEELKSGISTSVSSSSFKKKRKILKQKTKPIRFPSKRGDKDKHPLHPQTLAMIENNPTFRDEKEGESEGGRNKTFTDAEIEEDAMSRETEKELLELLLTQSEFQEVQAALSHPNQDDGAGSSEDLDHPHIHSSPPPIDRKPQRPQSTPAPKSPGFAPIITYSPPVASPIHTSIATSAPAVIHPSTAPIHPISSFPPSHVLTPGKRQQLKDKLKGKRTSVLARFGVEGHTDGK